MTRSLDSLQVKSKLFRGLSDPSRLSILEALRSGPKNVTEIVAATDLSQPNASMHLDCLWCCGLVDRKARGRFMYYRIRSRRTLRILQAAQDLLTDVYDRIVACSRYEGRKDRP